MTKIMIVVFRLWPIALMFGGVGLFQAWKVGWLEHDLSSAVFLSGFVSYLVGGIGALVERDAKSANQSDVG